MRAMHSMKFVWRTLTSFDSSFFLKGMTPFDSVSVVFKQQNQVLTNLNKNNQGSVFECLSKWESANAM